MATRTELVFDGHGRLIPHTINDPSNFEKFMKGAGDVLGVANQALDLYDGWKGIGRADRVADAQIGQYDSAKNRNDAQTVGIESQNEALYTPGADGLSVYEQQLSGGLSKTQSEIDANDARAGYNEALASSVKSRDEREDGLHELNVDTKRFEKNAAKTKLEILREQGCQ